MNFNKICCKKCCSTVVYLRDLLNVRYISLNNSVWGRVFNYSNNSNMLSDDIKPVPGGTTKIKYRKHP